MIDVVAVTHHYGIKPVLRDVNLHIQRGDVVALMGPNGMGKSTLMGVMAGALWPVHGYVAINGLRRRASEADELAIRRRVVYLPASPWLPQSSTPRQWLLGVGRVYEVDDDGLMDHVPRLLELFNLIEQADTPIAALSTGQRKKVALCAALVCEAPVLLLDEPFAGGLDPSGILALKRVLQKLAHGDEFTIVLATPVPELVEELADKIAIVRDGRIVAYDTIDGLRQLAGKPGGKLDEVYEQLASPGTARNIERYFADSEPGAS
jgi:ABC-type multidrug transport system ATPase subunit